MSVILQSEMNGDLGCRVHSMRRARTTLRMRNNPKRSIWNIDVDAVVEYYYMYLMPVILSWKLMTPSCRN